VALTRSFKETVQARAQSDPAFRDALLRDGIQLVAGFQMKLWRASAKGTRLDGGV
jgi:hypothetical protein